MIGMAMALLGHSLGRERTVRFAITTLVLYAALGGLAGLWGWREWWQQ